MATIFDDEYLLLHLVPSAELLVTIRTYHHIILPYTPRKPLW